MTQQSEVLPYAPAASLYRQAVVAARRARICAQEYAMTGNDERRMREIAAHYVEAQELALPIVADRWLEREKRRQEKERAKKRPDERPQPGLFD